MINTLGSSDPNPILGDEATTFDRLVVTWDADFGFPRKDGTVLHKKGELHDRCAIKTSRAVVSG
jgi:hypothetical protein